MNDINTNITGMATEPAVIAMAQVESKLRAVCLRRQGAAFEVLWVKSCDVDEKSWQSFAAECGLSAEQPRRIETGGDKIAVVGFDSTRVVFYCIRVPAVREEEVAAIVRLQAESRLPLPAEQMKLAWRAGRVKDGQVAVTIAVARSEQLQKFLGNVRGFKPAKILLDYEGIVKAWRTFFPGNDGSAVVINIGSRHTQVCLAEGGRLSNAASLEMGMEDFSTADGPFEEAETAERFAQDTRSTLELFGYADPMKIPIFVLSDGGSSIEAIVSSLGSAGFNVDSSVPQTQKLRVQTGLSAEELYRYRLPIGLGLMAFDSGAEELNIFRHLYSPAKKGKKKHWLHSLKAACAVAAVMLALLVAVLYAVDVANEIRLRDLETETDFKLLMQRQKLIKTVAQQRPDLLELLREINSGENSDIKLDSFNFKKGSKVIIGGYAPGDDRLSEFEKNLLSKKGVTEVTRQSASKEQKGEKIKFRINFHYKQITRKGV